MSTTDLDRTLRSSEPTSEPLARSFRSEELAGLRLTMRAVLATAAVLGLWLIASFPIQDSLYYLCFLVVLCAIHVAHYRVRLTVPHLAWVGYVAVALSFAGLTTMFLLERALFDEPWPPQDLARNGNVIFYAILIAPVALTYSPRLMIWAGVVSAAGWAAIVAWVMLQPDTIVQHGFGLPHEAHLALHKNPHFVEPNMRIAEIVLLLLLAGILAVVVWRSRRLVIRQSEAERARTNLARYFPPNMVDELITRDQPLATVRAQPVAVLFADIVGFTALAERESPDGLIVMLREFHARMERAVFEHAGTLDKFLGDGLMATFGTPTAGAHDAANAVACARDMHRAIDEWNERRAHDGAPPIQLSVGVHYGQVVLGDVGSERRLELAVLGDVVNVASRLEELTRELACRAVFSDTLVQVARRETGLAAETLLSPLTAGPPQVVRGRTEPVSVWTL